MREGCEVELYKTTNVEGRRVKLNSYHCVVWIWHWSRSCWRTRNIYRLCIKVKDVIGGEKVDQILSKNNSWGRGGVNLKNVTWESDVEGRGTSQILIEMDTWSLGGWTTTLSQDKRLCGKWIRNNPSFNICGKSVMNQGNYNLINIGRRKSAINSITSENIQGRRVSEILVIREIDHSILNVCA